MSFGSSESLVMMTSPSRSSNFSISAGVAVAQAAQSLEAAGSAVERVIKVNIYIVDMAEFATLNEVYPEFFGAHRPARAKPGLLARRRSRWHG